MLAVLCAIAQSQACYLDGERVTDLGRFYIVVDGSHYSVLVGTALGLVLGYWPS